MSRIAATFARLKEQNRKALIPFVTAGDPNPAVTVPLMHAMVEAGANIIELGVPFSDPMADGPVIQKAAERALEHHVSLHDVLAMVKEFRKQDNNTPVVLMGYLNPVEAMGYEAFATASAEAGVDGVLTVDMPPEEGDVCMPLLREKGIDPIFLIAPTSTPARIKSLTESASGFVYYVSLKGVTGAGHLDTDAVATKLAEIRQVTDLPLGVGFGIKDAETASAVGKAADAVVVGSAIVKKIEENADNPELITANIVALLSSIRGALDAL
jgi:tryptophan synthase alpha chain